jgi:two-component system OmpR family response regulator
MHGINSLRHVLLVDGEAPARHDAVSYLNLHGLDVAEAEGLHAARLFLTQHRFDVVIVSNILDDGECLDLVRDLALSRFPPVVVTSAATDEADRIVALEMGADDYLAKPYSPRELLARLRTIHRRSFEARRLPQSRIATFDRWRLNLAAHQLVADDGTEVTLTSGELGVLRTLLEHPFQVIRREDFLAFTREDDTEVFERTVDVLIMRIRAKVERDPRHPVCLRTIRGGGYQLRCPVSWSASDPP